jgi:hypothetical protein
MVVRRIEISQFPILFKTVFRPYFQDRFIVLDVKGVTLSLQNVLFTGYTAEVIEENKERLILKAKEEIAEARKNRKEALELLDNAKSTFLSMLSL